MKRTTETYQKLCSCCGGNGLMENVNFNPNVTSSAMHIICIVCNGSGTQTVTKVIEED